jgi:hypothetical protein
MIIPASAESGQTGITLSFPVISQDPSNLHGYRGCIWYQPTRFAGKHVQLYFDAAYAHYWVHYSALGKNSLSIYSASPIARFYFFDNNPKIKPFIDLSIGVSYLSETRLADRRFGMHFAFQDLISLGIVFGDKHQVTLSGSVIHYSNGSLAKTNAGITIPLLINVGYRF